MCKKKKHYVEKHYSNSQRYVMKVIVYFEKNQTKKN